MCYKITTHLQEAVLQREQSINWGQGESTYKSKNTTFQTFIFTIKIICMQTENNVF